MSGTDAAPANRIASVFHRHLLAFVLVNVSLTIANVVTGAPWWAFWPLFVWSAVLLPHFLWYKAVTVDEDWVNERVGDVRSRSYDLAHLDEIRQSGSPVTPPESVRTPPRS